MPDISTLAESFLKAKWQHNKHGQVISSEVDHTKDRYFLAWEHFLKDLGKTIKHDTQHNNHSCDFQGCGNPILLNSTIDHLFLY